MKTTPTVEDDARARGRSDLNAGSVAAKTQGFRAWLREGAACPPEMHVHGATCGVGKTIENASRPISACVVKIRPQLFTISSICLIVADGEQDRQAMGRLELFA